MSTNRDLVREAISDGASSSRAVIEATALEAKQVSNVIFQLKQAGEVTVVDGELQVTDRVRAAKPNGEAGPAVIVPKRRGRPKKSEQPPSGKKPRKAKRKVGKRAKRAPQAASPDQGRVDFARFGDYVVLRTSDLAELMRMLERWSGFAKALE